MEASQLEESSLYEGIDLVKQAISGNVFTLFNALNQEQIMERDG